MCLFSASFSGTFDTQNAAVMYTDSDTGTVTIQCTFVPASSTRGCLVTLSDSPGCEMELYRTNNDLQVMKEMILPQGTYHPKAYDIEKDGTKSMDQPAVTLETFVLLTSITKGKKACYLKIHSIWNSHRS